MVTLRHKLEHVAETAQRIAHAHRATHQLLFSESNDLFTSLPGDRTSAHSLIFLWPSIRSIVDNAQIQVHNDYVIRAEDRPLLDPHVCRPANRMSSNADGDSQGPSSISSGGLTAYGSLDLDSRTLETLLSSYLNHIHILHPFLDKKRLSTMMDAFTDTPASKSAQFNAAGRFISSSEPRLKRKRSGMEGEAGGGLKHPGPTSAPELKRMEKATVCLVLALGRICLHQASLPKVFDCDPSMEPRTSLEDIWNKQDDEQPSPAVLSRPTHPPARGHASLKHYDPRPGASDSLLHNKQNHSSAPTERNLDAIPGLAYYTAAMDGLGSDIEGTTLAHAHLFALAGLYKDQLARVRESVSWISKAGQVIRRLMQAERLSGAGPLPVLLPAHNSISEPFHNEETYHDALKLMAWSILQLEHNNTAQFGFPSSGLPALELASYEIPESSIESCRLPGIRDHPQTHNTVVLFHNAQRFLCTRLNNAYGDIYSQGEASMSSAQLQAMLREHYRTLTQWRAQLPYEIYWKNDEQPPSDILHARLRAKYWEVQCVITRPFLDYTMNVLRNSSSSVALLQTIDDTYSSARKFADTRLLEAIADMPHSEVEEMAETCINAAMQSVVAYDGMSNRAIDTNLHGTVHA